MRTLHVTHRAWPVVGGSERYVQEIARRQVLDGHQVAIVATDAADLSALWDQRGHRVRPEVPGEHQGVRIRRLPVQCLPLGRITFPALRRFTWLVSALFGRVALPLARFSPWVPGLQKTLVEESADLLFAWNVTLEGLTAAVAREAGRRGVPWVAVPLLHLGRGRFYTMPHQLDLLRQAKVILAQTPGEAGFLLACGFDAERIRIASPGVDLEEADRANGQRFRQKHGLKDPIALSLGALSYDKGAPHLLAAARKLWGEGHRFTVVLLGPQQESVERMLARVPERDRASCLYLGQVSEEEKWDAVDAADVVAMPSRTESFGIVFLEGWARGKPVVGARAGAAADVIRHGIDGLLVEFGDVPGLAAALCELLEDSKLAAEMGGRGREKVLQMSTWDLQYARWRDVVGQATRV